MKLPVDVSKLTFVAGGPAQKAKGEGYDVQVMALGSPNGAELIRVRVPDDPKVKAGEAIRIDGLVTGAASLAADAIRGPQTQGPRE